MHGGKQTLVCSRTVHSSDVRQHMKNILLIFTILLFTVNSVAQECEFVEYYPLVKLASKNYSDKNYEDAEKNLKLAFTKTDHPLGADLH